MFPRIAAASVAVVGDLDSVVRGPFDSGDDVAPITTSASVQNLERVKGCRRRNAHHADTVVLTGNRSRYVSAVAVVIHRVVIVVHKVHSTEAVSVQLGMAAIDTGVNDGDFHIQTFVVTVMNQAGTDALHPPRGIQLGV